MDRSRLEAFSDGVFAVAITLLALDLTVAGPAGHGSLTTSCTRNGRPSSLTCRTTQRATSRWPDELD
jgi:hypothetical protein